MELNNIILSEVSQVLWCVGWVVMVPAGGERRWGKGVGE
jgi:hypothetical protein